jgi:preprotein translocase subunit SecG
MSVLFSIFIIIICILLILIVLVQNSKGGGLASNFAASNQFMGVRKTADFLEKATWTLAGCLLFLSLLSTITQRSKDSGPKSAIEDNVRNTPDPNAVQNYPIPGATDNKTPATPAPANNGGTGAKAPKK